MFSLIWAWTNGWANHRDVSDLRHHHAHYDVTVMWTAMSIIPWMYRADSRFASSQSEMAFLCNDISHWLGASLDVVCLKWENTPSSEVIGDPRLRGILGNFIFLLILLDGWWISLKCRKCFHGNYVLIWRSLSLHLSGEFHENNRTLVTLVILCFIPYYLWDHSLGMGLANERCY